MTENENKHRLYINDQTTPADVMHFVARRVESPARPRDGVVAFNFRNDPLRAVPLEEWAQDAADGVYVMPYQVSGVWAFMQRVLPAEIRNGDLLAYRKNDDEYVDYENWRATYVQPDESFDDDGEVKETIRTMHQRGLEVLDDV